MGSYFPEQSELGRLLSSHEVRWTAHPVRWLPGVFGVLSLVGGILALGNQDAKAGGIALFFALGVVLCGLTLWLVARRRAAGPACAVYEGGIALREGTRVSFHRWAEFGRTKVMMRGIQTKLFKLIVNPHGSGAPQHLLRNEVRGLDRLDKAIEAHRPG